MSVFEVVRGVEGFALYLDDTRIAGQKPWGGGEVVIKWETNKTYVAMDAVECEVDSNSIRKSEK